MKKKNNEKNNEKKPSKMGYRLTYVRTTFLSNPKQILKLFVSKKQKTNFNYFVNFI